MLKPLMPPRALLTLVRQPQACLQRRAFLSPTIALRADLVQDLYLRELKSYKPPPLKSSDAEGHVQKFAPPKAPKSPEESDIASELKAYENQQVEVEGQAASGDEVSEQDWFEEDEAEEHAAH